MYRKCNLKIGCLNIGGNAKMKCVSPDLVGIITKHDIFIVLETWLEGQDQCPKIDGFMNFRSERNKKSRAKRNSGGLIVYYRQTIGKGVHKLKSTSSDIIWIKLDKSYFGIKNDVFLCAAYRSTTKRIRLLFSTWRDCNHWRPEQQNWKCPRISYWAWFGFLCSWYHEIRICTAWEFRRQSCQSLWSAAAEITYRLWHVNSKWQGLWWYVRQLYLLSVEWVLCHRHAYCTK